MAEKMSHSGLVGIYALADSNARLPNDIDVEQMDHAHLLEHGNKVVWRNEAVRWVYPASQRLKAAELARNGANDWLVVNLDVARAESRGKRLLYVAF